MINYPTPNKIIKPGLYIIATPIGNIFDISLRALEVLKQADDVICEDTRVTNSLLNHYGIKKSLHVYNDHSAEKIRPKILKKLFDNNIIALVSDAGMPVISDPGYKLVHEAIKNNIHISCIPGASAITTAIPISGMPCDQFVFLGFLPTKSKARITLLERISNIEMSIIFYETANRLIGTLGDIRTTLGNIRIAVMRELTKEYEEIKRGDIDSVISYFKNNAPRGEIVAIIEKNISSLDRNLDNYIMPLMSYMNIKNISEYISSITEYSKKEVYGRALELKKE